MGNWEKSHWEGGIWSKDHICSRVKQAMAMSEEKCTPAGFCRHLYASLRFSWPHSCLWYSPEETQTDFNFFLLPQGFLFSLLQTLGHLNLHMCHLKCCGIAIQGDKFQLMQKRILWINSSLFGSSRNMAGQLIALNGNQLTVSLLVLLTSEHAWTLWLSFKLYTSVSG